MQKKKFDDLFNNLNNADFNSSMKSNKNANNNVNTHTKTNLNNKNFLDDFLFDDENIKPTNNNKKLGGNVYNPNKNNNNTNANFFSETSADSYSNLNNSNKRKGINQIKSGRKDILEEIFGDDLFQTSNRTHTPTTSKNKPNISKKNNIPNANTNANYNKYDDLFANPTSNANNNKGAKNNELYDFNTEPTFLQDEHNKPDNQFNTRRSRYVPSGKRDTNNNNLFNVNTIPSAKQQQNSAKGWNKTPIKITVGNGGIGPSGGGGGIGSGKQASYVPSFVGSGKGDTSKPIGYY